MSSPFVRDRGLLDAGASDPVSSSFWPLRESIAPSHATPFPSSRDPPK